MKTVDVAILGGGPAGATAAVYALRYSLSTIIISENIGGWMREAPMISNFPSAPGEINGLDLSAKFKEQLNELKAEIVEEKVIQVKKVGNIFYIKTNNSEYAAKTVIYALGSEKRKLNVPGETEFFGKGVSACVTCDGPLFSGRVVGVVGGGDSAAVAALMLSEYAKEVHLFSKELELRSKPSLTKRMINSDIIKIHKGVSILKINGEKFLNSVNLDNKKEIELQGLFIEVGMIPTTKIAQEVGVKIGKWGLIEVKEDMATAVPGFFAAGDLTTGSNRFRQIATAVGEGAIAANSTYEYLRAK